MTVMIDDDHQLRRVFREARRRFLKEEERERYSLKRRTEQTRERTPRKSRGEIMICDDKEDEDEEKKKKKKLKNSLLTFCVR